MNVKQMIDSAHRHLLDSKILKIMFWCSVLVFSFGSIFEFASIQAWSGLSAAFAGISYLESKAMFQKTRMELAKEIGIDHLIKR